MKKHITQFEFERKITEAKLSDKKRTIINLGDNLFITVRSSSEKLTMSELCVSCSEGTARDLL